MRPQSDRYIYIYILHDIYYMIYIYIYYMICIYVYTHIIYIYHIVYEHNEKDDDLV